MITLRTYVTLRVAVARQILENPNDSRYREAFSELKHEYLAQHLPPRLNDAEPLPLQDEVSMLLQRQAG